MKAGRILGSLAITLALVAPAWATGGLIDSHDVNNTNVPIAVGTGGNATATGGAGIGIGGEGGKGGDAKAAGVGVGVGVGKGGHGGEGGKGGKGGSSTVTVDTGSDIPAQAPAVFAPNLTAVPETCMGSISTGGTVGLQGTGVGFTFGTTWKSHDCELRMFARSLISLGVKYESAAVALLAQNDDVRNALAAAGIDVPGQQRTAANATDQVSLAASTTPASIIQTGGVVVEKKNPVTSCQGNDLLVRAANGETFCRAR